MQWPTPQDYNETVQSPDFCFDNQELQQGAPETNAMGLPKAICGNFASVYQFQCANRSVAVKCFLRNVYNQHQRYGNLSTFTEFNHVSTLLEFEYLLKGILVNGNWFPIVKMPWVEGLTLDQFVRKHMHNKQQIDRFLSQFTDLVLELERHGIAHGDLQHGNIIVRNKDLMLVDYDGIYVPAMAGEQANELGHVNYQHPERSAEYFDATIDRFSAWIIHHSLYVLRLDPTLWQRHSGGDERLIFGASDYKAPENSRLLAELMRHPVPEINKRAQEIKKLLSLKLSEIPPFRPAGWDTRVDRPVEIQDKPKPASSAQEPPRQAWQEPGGSQKSEAPAAGGSGASTGFVMGSASASAQASKPASGAPSASPPWYGDASARTAPAAGASGSRDRSGGPGSVLRAAQDYSKMLAESDTDEIRIPSRSESRSAQPPSPLSSTPPPPPPPAPSSSAQQTSQASGAPERSTSEIHIPQRFPRLSLMRDAILMDDEAFSDPALKMGRALKDDQWEGRNGFVLRIAGKEKHYAVKCFLSDSADRKQRYESIARHNMKDAGKYLVSFQYQSKGLRVGEQWLPILRMGFIDGKRIDDYVRFQLRNDNKHEIQRIMHQFRDMVWALNAAGIAHGDLEPGNILVDSRGNLRLVDYDNMYVPSIAHLQSAETGHPLFQHPSRTLGHFGPYLDNFSALVIDSVLQCMALAPNENLWNWETFIQQLRPSNSWKQSTANTSQDAIQRAGRLIREMQKYRIDQVPTLNASR